MSDLNVWKANPNLDTYLFARTNHISIRFRSVIGLLSVLAMLIGMINFFNLSFWYWILFAPFGFIFVFGQVLRYYTQIFYPKFDVDNHILFVQKTWNDYTEPSVDVFLPWCGEAYDVYEEVLKGCTFLDYQNYKVYLLDDKGDSVIEKLAHKYGYNYLSRPNKGEYRKAGNLRYGYEHSDGEFVVVFDADFIPARNFLKETLPYVISNPKTGILQTPQFFEMSDEVADNSVIEYGAGVITEDFYRIDLPSRDVFKASICVGTSAVYRRKAVMDAGGPPRVWGTEDVRQGLLISRAGYYVRYSPLIVSIGKAPETLQSYFRQHDRWCTGSVTLPFSHYYTKAKISIYARISYLTNITYYLTEGFMIFYSFHLLALLFFHPEDLLNYNSLYFVPFLLFEHIWLPVMRISKTRLGNILAGSNNVMTYLYSLPRVVFNNILPWEAAGLKTTKLNKSFLSAVLQLTLIVLVFFVLFLFVIIDNPNLIIDQRNYVILLWCLFFLVIKSYHLYFAYAEVLNSVGINWSFSSRIKNISLSKLRYPYYAMPLIVLLTYSGLNISYYFNGRPDIDVVNHRTNIGRYLAGNNNSTKIVSNTGIVDGIADKDKKEIKEHSSEFSYIAQKNDFYYKLARQAVKDYFSKHGIQRDEPSMIRSETYLIERMGYTGKTLEIGTVVEFDEAMLQDVVQKSLQMSTIERSAWSQYSLPS
jgi:cellulose synthase (UDP-forming)